MNTSTLDKATDKIINQMTPEELAKYTSSTSFHLAHLLATGETTQEEVDKRLDLVSQKHLTFHDPNNHIRYLKALVTETNTQMTLAMGEQHLRFLDSKIESSELVIVSLNLASMWIDSFSMRSTSDDVSEEKIATALNEIEKLIKMHLKRIDFLKEESAKFLNHERWSELGAYPKIEERESLLQPVTVSMYGP